MRIPVATAFLLFAVLCVSAAHAQDPPPASSSQAQNGVQVLRIGGNVMTAKLVYKMAPVYPEIAKRAHVSGTIVLRAILQKDGSVQDVQVISGPNLLIQAAIDAVKQWKYQPTLLNGQPVEVDTTVSIVFDLGNDGDASSNPAQMQATAPTSPIDPQLKANILKLLDLSHAMDMGQKMVKSMMQQMRPQLLASLPATPHRDEIVDAYGNKLAALLSSQEVVDQIVVVYAKHFSADDIGALIQFYQTPAGQHALTALPQVMAESMQIGANAARTNVPAILKELCSQYPELRGKVDFCAADRNESGKLKIPVEPLSSAGRP